MKTKSTPIFSYIARYWILLLLLALAVWLALSDWLFQIAGTLVYLPVLTLGAAATALLLRNVFNHQTTDFDSDSGWFASAWRRMPDRERVWISVIQFLVYFAVAGWIAAALIK